MANGKYVTKMLDGNEYMAVNSWNYEEAAKVKHEMKIVEKQSYKLV